YQKREIKILEINVGGEFSQVLLNTDDLPSCAKDVATGNKLKITDLKGHQWNRPSSGICEPDQETQA
ncbi:hypothetical protein L9F63_024443, partial [Diploptera punctata]